MTLFAGIKTVKTCVFSAFAARPWTIDIISGLQMLGLGTFFWFDPLAILHRSAYTFLDRLPPLWLETTMICLGAIQIIAGLSVIFWFRAFMAFIVLYFYTSFVFGLIGSDIHAYGIIVMMIAALANVLIIMRFY